MIAWVGCCTHCCRSTAIRLDRLSASAGDNEPVNAKVLTLVALSVGVIGASVGLGIWAVAVYAPCAKPYAECAANGHLGELWGGILLFILTAVIGLFGLVMFIASLWALFKPRAVIFPGKIVGTYQVGRSPLRTPLELFCQLAGSGTITASGFGRQQRAIQPN